MIISCVLYLLSLNAYYVGGFNDDAFYILGARSLLQGRYVELNTPGAPPLINYMPGYPLLLVPVVAIFGGHFVWYQLYSILMVLGTVFLLWRLLDQEPLSVRVPTVLLSAFNPLVVSTSGVVLSDIPFLFLSVFLFNLLKERWQSENAASWALISFVAISAYYMRIIGAALCIAIILVLVVERRWRAVLVSAAVMLSFFLPFYLRNLWARGIGSWYVAEFSDPYASGSILKRIGELVSWQFPFYLHELFVRSFFRWPPSFPLEFEFLAIAICIGALLIGIFKRKPRSVGYVMLIYLALYAAVHLAWHRQASRYLIPVLPFVYHGFFRGLKVIDDKKWLPASAGWIAMAIALLLFIKPVQYIIHTSLYVHNAVNTPPEKTFSWIQFHTSPDAVFAAELDAQLYLFTERKTFHFRKDLSRVDFYRWSRMQNIDYLLLIPTDFILATKNKNTVHDPLSADALQAILVPDRFEKVFENAEERTQVWKVIKA